MLKYTRSNLKKIESYLTDRGYSIIYEKGQFKSGYCIVNASNVIVVNKFFDVEARINVLHEIVINLDLQDGLFSSKSISSTQVTPNSQ